MTLLADSLRGLLALCVLGAASSFCWQAVRRTLVGHSLPLQIGLTYALSLGIFTNLLAWVGFWRIHPSLTVLLLGLGWIISRRLTAHLPPAPAIAWRAQIAAHSWFWLALGAVLFFPFAHSTYFPFIGDDTLSRYALASRQLIQAGSLYGYWLDGYPLHISFAYLIPLQFAPNVEQIAKLVAFGYALAMLACTYGLAVRWMRPQVGAWAVLALVISPLFLYWAAFEYVDIPTGVYFVLSAYFLHEWRTQPSPKNALLVGILLGLGIWSKQAGFAALISAGLVGLGWLISEKLTLARWKMALWSGGWILVGALLFGGWWYVRNAVWLGWQGAIPSPGSYYASLAQPTLAQVYPFLKNFNPFGIPTSIFVSLGGLVLLRQNWRKTHWQNWLELLAWIAPYQYLWWTGFSYDVRFLLTILPFWLVFASDFWSRLGEQFFTKMSVRWLLAGLTLALGAWGVWESRLGGILRWWRDPLASYATRITIAKGPLYPTAQYILENIPTRARLYAMDGRLAYFLADYSVAYGYPRYEQLQGQYDYFVVGSWAESVYPALQYPEMLTYLADPTRLPVVFASDGNGLSVRQVR